MDTDIFGLVRCGNAA